MAANAIDLTWLNAVKQKAGVGINASTGAITPSVDDNEIQAAITAFSLHLLNFTGQGSLNSFASYDDIYDGNGNARIMLRNYPIVNVSSVTMSGVGIPQSSGPTTWGWYVETSKKSIALRGTLGNFTTFPYANTQWGNFSGASRKGGPVFMYGQGNIEVKYTAGYPPTAVVNELDTITAQTVTLQVQPWAADNGVLYYPSLLPFMKVPNSPTAGEYAVVNGLYVFNAADNGNVAAVSYTATLAPSDLEYAVRCVVSINYKRKGWQDLASRAISTGGTTGTTRYQNWEWPPEYDKIFKFYKRGAMYA